MSHSVHHIFPSSCLSSSRLPDSTLLSKSLRAELKNHDFPAESELVFDDDAVSVAFSVEFGLGVLWTNINYSRFLYANERVRTVDSIDAWVRAWCSTVVRVDELFVDQWFAQLDAAPPSGPATLADFIRWLSNANPERTHWVHWEDTRTIDPGKPGPWSPSRHDCSNWQDLSACPGQSVIGNALCRQLPHPSSGDRTNKRPFVSVTERSS